MLSAQPVGGLGFWPVDQIVDAAKEAWEHVEDAAEWVYDNVGDAISTIQHYGCAIVNNDICVSVAAGGAMIYSPAASAGVKTGAAIGQQACRVIKVSQAVLDQLKRQSTPTPPPPGVSPPAPPSGVMVVAQVRAPGIAPPAPAGKYKRGSIARFNTTRQLWSVYSPLAGAGIGVFSSFGGACLFGDCELGEAAVEPPVPAGFVKAGEEAGAAPPPGTNSAGTERDRPFYKSPVVLAIGGVVVLGGATAAYLHFRTPRRQLAGPAWRKRKIRRLHQRRAR